jgi:hypothetical protein
MTKFLTITIILTLGLSCSTTKGPYTYEVCVRQAADTSYIVKNEMIGIADTTTAFLKGLIIDKDSKELLGFANVSLTDTTTNKIYGQSTDSLGQFSITLPADNYILRINYVGYQSIKQEIELGTGEIREMNVELGQGDAFVTYEIKSEKKLNRRQLNKKAEELKKKK